MPTAEIRWQRRWLLWAVGFWLLLALAMPARVWWAIIVPLVLLPALSYIWVRQLARGVVWARRVRQGIMVVGDQVVEDFEIENLSPFPLLWVEIVDHSNVPGYRADRVEAVDAHGHRGWQTQGRCERRGLFHLGPWEAISGDPLGIFNVYWHFPVERTVLIYPRIVRLPEIPLPRGMARGQAREWHPSPTEDISASGIRPYHAGDTLHRIHWRQTAHRGALMSRLFDMEPSGDLWLILDLDARVQAGKGARSTEEYAVILAASLAARMLTEGRRVGLTFAGEHPAFVAPQAGTGHLWTLMGYLARAHSAPHTSLADLLQQMVPTFGQGRTLVIFTPSWQTDWVARLAEAHQRGLAASVIWLDGSTFMETPDPARANAGSVLRALLARIDVPMLVITRDFPFEVVLKIRRKRKVLKVLPATGRVIEVEVEEEV